MKNYQYSSRRKFICWQDTTSLITVPKVIYFDVLCGYTTSISSIVTVTYHSTVITLNFYFISLIKVGVAGRDIQGREEKIITKHFLLGECSGDNNLLRIIF